jgi:protein O-GlcNAc transferase
VSEAKTDLQNALALHRSGQLAAAERIYREILRVFPDHFDATHLLGACLLQRRQFVEGEQLIAKALKLNPNDPSALNSRGSCLRELKRLDEALASYDKAIAVKPDFAEAFNNRGNCLRGLKRLDEALTSYDKAIALKPDFAEAFNNRGDCLQNLKRLDQALTSYDKAIALKPDYAEAFSNRGNCLQELERLDEALTSYDKAIALKPDYADAFYNRGGCFQKLGRLDEALTSYDRAVALNPDYADAFNNAGNALGLLKRLDEALASYDRAIALKPDYAEALNNRGVALRELKRLDEALASYDRAIALKPDYADAFNNRGVALRELRRLDEALASYDRAIALKPDSAEAFTNRGVALTELRRPDEALASYDRAIALKPDYADAFNNRGTALLDQSSIDEAIICYKRALAIKADEPSFHSNLIFALNFDLAATTVGHQAERARWDRQHAQQFSAVICPHANDPDPDRLLRIGYVSSHFCHQAATYAFGGVLLSHDPKLFEVACYSDTLQEDDFTARLRERVGKWRRTAGLSDDALADQIRADGIDILVDLVGHMRGHRLLVFARKPAPVQVTAWGEPTGTGLSVMDYLLADPVLVPATERALLIERVVDLPNFLGYWLPDPLPEAGALPALGRGYVTFGSFNRLAKIQDPVLRIWGSILRALPQAHLVLKTPVVADSHRRARLGAILAEEGVTAERVKLLGPTNRTGHFIAYQDIDIALDPFPHGGGMTTLDAMWMGVPVVTWSGRTISSRLAAASLTALGMTDFIAPDLDTYVEVAIAKATDVDALSRLRGTLRQRVADSSFGDPARYAGAVEAAYRQMWRCWCAKRTGKVREQLAMDRS